MGGTSAAKADLFNSKTAGLKACSTPAALEQMEVNEAETLWDGDIS